MDWFSNLLFSFFIVMGIIETSRLIISWILHPRKRGKVTMLVTMKGHEEEAEYVLRSMVEQLRWMNSRDDKELLCVDRGMDEETRRICEIMAREYPFIRLCFPQDLKGILAE